MGFLKRLGEKAGYLLAAWLFASGSAMMYVHLGEAYPSPWYVFGFTLLAACVIMVMQIGAKSAFLTIGALAAALIAALITGWKPIGAIRLFIAESEQGLPPQYVNQIALVLSIALLIVTYTLVRDRHGVYVLITLTLIISAICWFMGQEIRAGYAVFPMIALSAQFSVSSRIKQSNTKALLSSSLIAAILASVLTPAGGVTFKPLEAASEKVLRSIIEFFNLDRNDVEERRTFNLISYGWRSLYDSFGGPARPTNDDVLRLSADKDETMYLRGSIRYTYNGRGWVDENNLDKAGKIKRYMTTGLEGRMYRDEYNNAFDLNKGAVLNRFFEQKTAEVDILSDNLYWSIYTPGRTIEVEGAGDLRVYYNNIGEMFLSRRLVGGDSYTMSYYSFVGDENALLNAVNDSAGDRDGAYQAALMLNLDVPSGVDPRLFALVGEIVSGSGNSYESAVAIRDYLKSQGTYTLNAEYVPAGEDFVSYFVLKDMRGYCMHFAAAMTLMARIAGMPARYVEGYLAKPNGESERVLTGQDAHAWCEVYFKGFGWVTFEATPGDGGDSQSGDRFDGEDETDQGSGGALPDTRDARPEPTPTPTPSPTPVPENWQEDENDEWDSNDEGETEENNGEQDEDDGETEVEPDAGDNETEPETEPESETDAGEDSQAQSETEGNDNNGTNPLWAIILLAALLIAALIAFIIIRLKNTDPNKLQNKYEHPKDKILVWYRACMAAIEVQGLSITSGYTPISYAEKARNMNYADESFVRFSRTVARGQYSEKTHPFDESEASLAYEEIRKHMKLTSKVNWFLRRVKSGLGSIEQLP